MTTALSDSAAAADGKPVRVLIVDDSALIRQMLTEMLGADPGLLVVGTAADPLVAREKIKKLNPDVITLDIEMPRMDGLTFLHKLMTLRPTPVVLVSTLTQQGAEAALRGLELGAVDYCAKPLLDVRHGMTGLREELIGKVKAAAKARVMRTRAGRAAPELREVLDHRLSAEGRVVAIGASTGGVEALQELLTALPVSAPGILVTQHMPAGFTAAFARRMNERCAVTVAEATDGARVMPGHVFIANGDRHLQLARSGSQLLCRLSDGPPVSGHRPSVDVLFRSVAAVAGRSATGVILTGMGRDGADGLLAMRRAGARTLGQDEASCLIYGMPKAAMQAGAVERELPLSRLAQAILV